MSIKPAIALLTGLLIVNQHPSLLPATGVILVVAGGIGETRTGARTATDPRRRR